MSPKMSFSFFLILQYGLVALAWVDPAPLLGAVGIFFNPLHTKYTYMCMGVVKKKKKQEKRKKDVP